MTTITTRAGKGAPLTNAELDANFTALNSGKLETTATTSDVAEGSNLYFTNARARAALSATGSLSYNSTTGVFSFTQGNSDTVTEGATNLYFTNARARSAISSTTGSAGYNSSTGVITIPETTAHISEGSNLYYTDARARAALSAGTGISYNSTTGVITSSITQYTDALARAAVSAGTGISYNSTTGVISSSITQYTDALARAAVSAGTGISYNSTTGVISSSITQYTDALSRAAHSFTAGSGAYNSTTGVITIPTATSHITNDSGYITSSALSSYMPLSGGTFTGNVTAPYLITSGANNGIAIYDRAGTNYWASYVTSNTFRLYALTGGDNRLTIDSSGNLTMAGNVTAYSDARLKSDWGSVQSGFVDLLASVQSGTYTRIDTKERQAGVSAQDLQKILPETVAADENGFLSVAYGNAALVAAIELAKEVRSLKAEIEKLKGK